MKLDAHIISLKFDTAFPGPVKDFYTKKRPVWWPGSNSNIRFSLFHNNEPLNIADFDSITAEIFSRDDLETPLFSRTTPSWELTQHVTHHGWEIGLQEHGVIKCDHGTANITETGQGDWHILALSAQTKGTPAKTITLGKAELVVIQEGIGTAEAPPDGDAEYLTKCQMDELYARNIVVGLNYQWVPDGDGFTLQIKNIDANEFHTVWIHDSGNTFQIEGADSAVDQVYLPSFEYSCDEITGKPQSLEINSYKKTESDALFLALLPEDGWFRFKKSGDNYYLQLKNTDTGKFHTIWIKAQGQGYAFEIEDGED